MKIQSLKYEDLSTGWKLDLTEFNPHLTLLVGVSGVGKTRILEALLNLKKISQGLTLLNGIKWSLTVVINTHQYKWEGSFKNKGHILESIYFREDEIVRSPLEIEDERLYFDNQLIVDRNNGNIIFNNKETIKLPLCESIIYLLREDIIEKLRNGFESIFSFQDLSSFRFFTPEGSVDNINENEFINIKDIRNSYKNIMVKTYLSSKKEKVIFEEIKNTFLDIFPYVEDIKIDPASSFFNNPVLQIKEKNISYWVNQLELSSGMFKTFILISELYLCSDDSILLLDEFENSLGINCIDEVTSSILASERNLQFIITSHHPYIINNIDTKYWKLVTRNGNAVKAEDAVKYGIGRSKHEAFTQLLNLDEYNEGIAS